MILHTVNKSIFASQTLDDCLRRVAPQDTVLLIEDGVYGAVLASPAVTAMLQLQQQGTGFLALHADLCARGLDETHLLAFVRTVDDREFVKLAARADKVQSWY